MIVLVLLVASSASGLAYALLTSDEYEAGLQRDRDRETAIAKDWCQDVTPYVGSGHAVQSFADLADMVLSGVLKTPANMPAGPGSALDRWQSEHGAYVTSLYLSALEGYPRELSIAEAALEAALEDARDGKASTVTPSGTRDVTRRLDQFVAEEC